MDKNKLNAAKDFVNEVISYLDGMPVLTDDEQSLLERAKNTLTLIK